MALLHRDRTSTDDTVAGPGTTDRPRPAWPDTADRAAEPRVIRKNSFGQTLATMLATVLLVAVVAIAAANTQQVDVDLLFEEYDLPLSALVGGAAGAGFLIGALLGWARGRHRAARRL
jgi:uncharacterized integral membrane protein